MNRLLTVSAAILVVVSGSRVKPFRAEVLAAQASGFAEAAEQQGASQPSPLGIPLGAPRAQVEALFEAAKIPRVASTSYADVYSAPPASIANAGQVYLYFYQGQLARIVCLIGVESQAADPYVLRFHELKEALTEKYGRPTKNWEYVDPIYRDHLLTAIETGKASYASFWKAGDIDVSLILRGDNYQIAFALYYENRPLSQKFDSEMKQAEKNKL